jgi:hypothetical protein
MTEKIAEYAAEGADWPLAANILDPIRCVFYVVPCNCHVCASDFALCILCAHAHAWNHSSFLFLLIFQPVHLLSLLCSVHAHVPTCPLLCTSFLYSLPICSHLIVFHTEYIVYMAGYQSYAMDPTAFCRLISILLAHALSKMISKLFPFCFQVKTH